MTAARQQRPQLAGSGERAILIAHRDQGDAQLATMSAALDTITSLGYQLLAIVDPGDYLKAHAMIAEGLADVIVTTRVEHLPSVRMASAGRTHPVLRSASGPQSQRRPQSVDGEQRTQALDRDEKGVTTKDTPGGQQPIAPARSSDAASPRARRAQPVDRGAAVQEPPPPSAPAAIATPRSQRRRVARRYAQTSA